MAYPMAKNGIHAPGREPEDIAAMAAFLAPDDSPWVNGGSAMRD